MNAPSAGPKVLITDNLCSKNDSDHLGSEKDMLALNVVASRNRLEYSKISFDTNFIKNNLTAIDKIIVHQFCNTDNYPCKHNIKIHLKDDDVWTEFKCVSGSMIIPFYDILSERDKEHFYYLICSDKIPLLIQRLLTINQQNMREKDYIIGCLREEIKSQNIEISSLKFKNLQNQE